MRRGSSWQAANTVLSVIAIVLALAGTGYAALKLTGKQIVDSSITGRDVRTGSLKSADIANRSLRARDFRRGHLPRGQRGRQGLAGPQGPAGPPGPQGPADPRRTFFAVMEVNGMLTESSPGVEQEPPRTGRSAAGAYSVGFAPNDVGDCAVTATVGNGPASGTTAIIPTAFVTVKNFGASVRVRTIDVDGNLVDAPFSIVVTC